MLLLPLCQWRCWAWQCRRYTSFAARFETWNYCNRTFRLESRAESRVNWTFSENHGWHWHMKVLPTINIVYTYIPAHMKRAKRQNYKTKGRTRDDKKWNMNGFGMEEGARSPCSPIVCTEKRSTLNSCVPFLCQHFWFASISVVQRFSFVCMQTTASDAMSAPLGLQKLRKLSTRRNEEQRAVDEFAIRHII